MTCAECGKTISVLQQYHVYGDEPHHAHCLEKRMKEERAGVAKR